MALWFGTALASAAMAACDKGAVNPDGVAVDSELADAFGQKDGLQGADHVVLKVIHFEEKESWAS